MHQQLQMSVLPCCAPHMGLYAVHDDKSHSCFSDVTLWVMQAIALGADAVMLGRPVLYGLALQGEEGVRKVLQMLKRELMLGMQLAGCHKLAAITQSLILPFGDSNHYGNTSKM